MNQDCVAHPVSWMIRDFIEATPGLRGGIVVSSDGLTLAESGGLSEDDRDRLSAVVSGIVALSKGALSICGGTRVNQTLVDMDQGYLCLMSISEGSTLGLVTHPACNIGLIAYEAARLVDRVGRAMTPAVRVELRRMMLN
ncbi:roadblock/LC7 domain-containing protein [Streptomyces sp. NPDC002537]